VSERELGWEWGHTGGADTRLGLERLTSSV
jgi:hypothetical protein